MQITDKFEIVPVAEITPDVRNARKHSDEQIKELRRSQNTTNASLASAAVVTRRVTVWRSTPRNSMIWGANSPGIKFCWIFRSWL